MLYIVCCVLDFVLCFRVLCCVLHFVLYFYVLCCDFYVWCCVLHLWATIPLSSSNSSSVYSHHLSCTSFSSNNISPFLPVTHSFLEFLLPLFVCCFTLSYISFFCVLVLIFLFPRIVYYTMFPLLFHTFFSLPDPPIDTFSCCFRHHLLNG